MRKRKALISIVFSLLLELVTILSGFIVPKLIIESFGSSVNGLINSITGFIGYISVLQLGVGSVIKASLYKPLAKKDKNLLNVIIKTSNDFFKKIGIATLVYIVILSVVFPILFAKEFEFVYTASLVVIIGIGTVFTYLYGITYQTLLEADQRSYVFSCVQIFTVLLNIVAVVVLVRLNASIHVVKAASTFFFVLRPLVLFTYCNKYYNLNLKVSADKNVISQRWDGFAQGLAYFLHSKTDVFVLTVFSTFENVSIYGVYALVTSGLNSLISSIDKAVRAAFGNILANDENEHLIATFRLYNVGFHMLCTSIFMTASISIFKFIHVYVGNITDADYFQPLFGYIIVAAEYIYCLRLPYYSIIYAAGKFKETKRSAFIEAGLNICTSCILVFKYGLIGVAIGTLVAMSYRTISFCIFLHNNILMFDYAEQIKRYVISVCSYVIGIFTLKYISFIPTNYFSFALYSLAILLLSFLFTVCICLIFDRKDIMILFQYAKTLLTNKMRNKTEH